MKTILLLTFLFGFPLLAEEDLCTTFKTQRKCESKDGIKNKCKWLKAKELCQSEQSIVESTGNNNEKGIDATEDESDRPSRKGKNKNKNKIKTP
ncbi:MAG TPA: hypothetical protein PK079_21365 [Leptospiraceae bacterium]|nr:hypothetical protein [Leptospiraceae bacterium]HMW03672.1 hypothetical protein [Leptospiraceae bacterium]HMX31201.1 hypothetical protein [Leptospiraceae bacterium]HMY29407.1 hypothetical protein [Leptospiraceae bacterium]HMZ66607.1 hypothetical protein [Leptospiraceae bacterium]